MNKRPIIPRPQWNAAFIAEICISGFLISALLVSMLSLGMQNITARYRYDAGDLTQTSIPFSVDQESEYFTVNIRFRLNPLHASTYVIGPDDCLESIVLNGREVDGANGLCNMNPGHVLRLSGARTGENTMIVRVHDTGGKGGLSIRTSWLDPLWMGLLFLFLAIFTWIGARVTLLWTRNNEAALLPAIMAIGLVIRLALSWHGGFGGDIHLNQEWSRSAVQIGVVESYDRQVNPEVMLPNYPPLNILMFAATGYLYRQTISPEFNPDLPAFGILIKLPAIIVDLIMVAILYCVLLPLGGRKKAIIASALYAVHPAVIHDSAIWGQTDSVFTLFMCLSLLFAQRNRWFWTGFMVATALLFKMQAIMVLPVLAVAAGLQYRRWLMMVLGGAAIAIPTVLPFLLKGAIGKVFDIYLHSVGYYSSLSSNAYNLWVMFYTRDTGRSATDLFLDIIEHRTLGITLWFIVIVSVTIGWIPAIRNDIQSKGKTGVTFFSAALIAYAFFLFNAEMHERYLFPYMAFALPLVLLGRKGVILYLSGSLLFLLNLTSLVAFTETDRVLLQETFGQSHPVAIATANVIVFFLTWSFLHAYQKTTLKGRSAKGLIDMLRSKRSLLRPSILR